MRFTFADGVKRNKNRMKTDISAGQKNADD